MFYKMMLRSVLIFFLRNILTTYVNHLKGINTKNENFLINSYLIINQDKVILQSQIMLNMLFSLWKVADSPLENQTTWQIKTDWGRVMCMTLLTGKRFSSKVKISP